MLQLMTPGGPRALPRLVPRPRLSAPPSFRGREHSDRRYAPSEHRRRERSPESITTGPCSCDTAHRPPPWGYGFRARWHVGKTDLPAPWNDAGETTAAGTSSVPTPRDHVGLVKEPQAALLA